MKDLVMPVEGEKGVQVAGRHWDLFRTEVGGG